MSQTPILGLPYSDVDDSPNGPNQQKELALATESELLHPHARYLGQTSQSIPQLTDTKMNFSTAIDTHGDIIKLNLTDFQLNRSGLWIINVSVRWQNVDTQKYASIIDSTNLQNRYAEEETYAHSICPSVTRRFSSGALISVLVFHTWTSAINIALDFNESNSISFTYLGQ